MDNQEIRAKARMLYRKYFAFALLLGFCGGGLSYLMSNLTYYFFPDKISHSIALSQGIALLIAFAAIPLTVGTVSCMEPFWMKEQCTLDSLFIFYYPLSRLGNSLILSLVPILLISIILVPGILLFIADYLPVWTILLLLIPILWLGLRLQMAMMLFASGRKKSGLAALHTSYQLMRGKEWDLLGMSLIVMFPQLIIILSTQIYTQHYGTNLFILLFVSVFDFLYLPYRIVAMQGWVLERLKDGEQPQESENKWNQGQFLSDMKKEVEPSSERFGDQ